MRHGSGERGCAVRGRRARVRRSAPSTPPPKVSAALYRRVRRLALELGPPSTHPRLRQMMKDNLHRIVAAWPRILRRRWIPVRVELRTYGLSAAPQMLCLDPVNEFTGSGALAGGGACDWVGQAGVVSRVLGFRFEVSRWSRMWSIRETEAVYEVELDGKALMMSPQMIESVGNGDLGLRFHPVIEAGSPLRVRVHAFGFFPLIVHVVVGLDSMETDSFVPAITLWPHQKGAFDFLAHRPFFGRANRPPLL